MDEGDLIGLGGGGMALVVVLFMMALALIWTLFPIFALHYLSKICIKLDELKFQRRDP